MTHHPILIVLRQCFIRQVVRKRLKHANQDVRMLRQHASISQASLKIQIIMLAYLHIIKVGVTFTIEIVIIIGHVNSKGDLLLILIH